MPRHGHHGAQNSGKPFIGNYTTNTENQEDIDAKFLSVMNKERSYENVQGYMSGGSGADQAYDNTNSNTKMKKSRSRRGISQGIAQHFHSSHVPKTKNKLRKIGLYPEVTRDHLKQYKELNMRKGSYTVLRAPNPNYPTFNWDDNTHVPNQIPQYATADPTARPKRRDNSIEHARSQKDLNYDSAGSNGDMKRFKPDMVGNPSLPVLTQAQTHPAPKKEY